MGNRAASASTEAGLGVTPGSGGAFQGPSFRAPSHDTQRSRDPTALAENPSNGCSVAAALGLAIEAFRTRRPHRIAAKLLHAVDKAINPPSGLRVQVALALTNMHEVGVAGVPTPDALRELAAPRGRRQMHHDVKMLSVFPLVVLAHPNPRRLDASITAPLRKPVAQTGKEGVEVARPRLVHVNGMEVEGRVEGSACAMRQVGRL
jgi:hypothetical protein